MGADVPMFHVFVDDDLSLDEIAMLSAEGFELISKGDQLDAEI